MIQPMVQLQRSKNLGIHFILKKKRSNSDVSTVSKSWLDNILASYDGDKVFCHVGLSSVNAAFTGGPYKFLREILHEHFDTIMSPGYTDYFIHSNTYHKEHSKPKLNIGMFSRLLLDDAEYRTNDAMKSIIVDGDYRFEDCNHSVSFGKESCFGKIERDNVLVLNIGTPWLKPGPIHHTEYVHDVPYMNYMEIDGVLFEKSGTNPQKITQTCAKYKSMWAINRRKLRKFLINSNVLDVYKRNGLRVMAMRAGDFHEALKPKLQSDPYYLVT